MVVRPREGSFALALFGSVRKTQEPDFAVIVAGRMSFALKRILEAVLVIFSWFRTVGPTLAISSGARA
jgi:hypothetical protein